MPSAADGTILLSSAQQDAIEDVQSLLQDAGHQVAWHALDDGPPSNPARFRTIIVEGGAGPQRHFDHCRKLRSRLQGSVVPILYLAEDAAPALRFDALQAGADAILPRPFSARELLAQVQALLRLKDAHDRLAERTREVDRLNQKLREVNQQMKLELDLARRIQLSFLPHTLPDLPGVRFAVRYDLIGQVGGDFYDIFRLDENHVGFYVADAMGHGVPASLLTIFVKKGVRAKEINGKQYRLIPPHEVLEHLNRDLVAQQLDETPFITMVYGLLNFRTGLLSYARAGHPYPIRVTADGETQLMEVPGSLMGVFDTAFTTATVQLRPGDKVLFFSDGIDTAVSNASDSATERLAHCASWLHALPIQQLVERVPGELFGEAGPGDDFTLLGVEFENSNEPRP